MWRGLFILLLWLLAQPGAAWAQAPVQMPLPAPLKVLAGATRLEFAGHLAMLKDVSGQLTLAQAMQSADWQPLPGEMNLGFTQAAIWLRLDLERDAAAPAAWLLEVTNPHHDDLRLYSAEPDGSWRERRAGEDAPHSAHNMDYRQAVFKIALPNTERHTLWLRLVSRNSVSAQLVLWQPEAFLHGVQIESLLYGLMFGVFIAVLLTHLFFWRWTREPVAGWYLVYAGSNMLSVGFTVGYIQQFLPASSVSVDVVVGFLICGVLWVATKFATLQLELARVMPRTERVLLIASGSASVICMALALGVRYSAGVIPAQVYSIVLVVVLLAIALLLWWRGHAPAKLFLLAFGVLMVGIFWRYLRTLGFIAPSAWTDNSYQVGYVVHMVLMSLAITGHYNQMKRDKLAAQAALSESLEKQVAERTVTLLEEITRRKKQEIETQRALDVEVQARLEQENFVSMVSHEFRTPLAIINTVTQQLARQLDAPLEKSLQRCTNIREATKRMTDMMDGFLALDRARGALRLSRGMFDPSQLFNALAAEWDTERVQVSYNHLPQSYLGDVALLRVALRNLMTNALRHSPADSLVRLNALGTPDGGMEISVTDEGVGIAEDELPKLFQKYFRGRAAQGQPGAGLGLYLVESITVLHGGTVQVDSTIKKGSRFVMRLPGHQE